MNNNTTKKEQDEIKKELMKIKMLKHNKYCADCDSFNTLFADVTFGCFLCLRCAGIHREFGTHVSRILSTTHDNFSVEQLSVFTAYKGNEYLNLEYEALGNFTKPSQSSSDKDVREFIKRKYINKDFYRKHQPVQQAVQQQIQQVVQQPIQQPVQQPVQQPIKQAVQQPIQQSVKQSNELIMFDPFEVFIGKTTNVQPAVQQPNKLIKFDPFEEFIGKTTNIKNDIDYEREKKINDILSLYKKRYS